MSSPIFRYYTIDIKLARLLVHKMLKHYVGLFIGIRFIFILYAAYLVYIVS